MSEQVVVREADGVMEVLIDRPEARNAMTRAAAEGIAAAMERLDSRADLRCAILSGTGGHFCAGMDLKGFLAGDLPIVADRGFGGLCGQPPRKPLIAAVDGFALAGGMELALACDLIVASADARFGIPEVTRGLIAAGGGVVRLPRRIPRAVAMELALTGEPIGAARAYELGLVNRVVEGPAIEDARKLARRIADNAPLAVVASKAMMRESWTWDEAGMDAKQAPFAMPIMFSADAREGAKAFAEKRKPEWKGR